MDRDTVFEHNGRVMVQVVDGESVLLDVDGGMYFALNEVGGRVWELCDGTRSVGSIAEVICTEYDVAATTALGDVDELLDGLVGAGLIRER